MIRINLLGVARTPVRKPLALGQKLTAICSLVLLLAGLFIGWRYWTLDRDSRQVDSDIGAAQQEITRLHAVIQQVQQFEQRRAQLQQRVTLIEQLRRDQKGPVQMLDQISRALPQTLWLSELKQVGNDVVIDGHCLSLTALSDFVANLEATGAFKRSIEIVSTSTEALPQAQAAGDVVKFSIKAQFTPPEGAAGPSAPVAGRKVGG